MTTSLRYDFGADRNGSEGSWTTVGEQNYRSSLRRIKESSALVQDTPEWAEDLLRVVRAAHLLDKLIARESAVDGWSRDIRLRVQVADTERWQPALGLLERLLSVLTSDTWHVTTRPGAPPIDTETRMLDGWAAQSVALFSGGLDSSAYAAQHLAERPDRLLLISHDQANAHAPQLNLMRHLKSICAEPGAVIRCPMSNVTRSGGERPESSTRSRGLGYIASAVFAAAAHRVDRVVVPENGQLAINPPLSNARVGACSTRSVHPMVLQLINELIRLIGGNVTVENPFLHLTKGDVCRIGAAAGLTPEALAETVSCGAHTVRRRYGNCGHCFPCLIRRSGLLSALGHDPTTYGHDLRGLSGRWNVVHVQDLQAWIMSSFTTRDLLGDVPIPASLPVSDAMSVIERGRDEIRQMFRLSLWSPAVGTD
jgi:7-cyano-7-deazaguanine synthase in queuosine biosynthesis